jgi:mono/diheme cytochrome c family protein
MKHSLNIALVLLLMSLLLSACGRSSSAGGPVAKSTLLAATPISTHVFKQPTTIIKEEAVAEKVETPEAATPEAAAPEDLARGERTYTNKSCGDCHGAQGEGVEGKGSKLAGTAVTEQAFTDFLRTGGAVGNSHLYGPQSISPSGMEALYLYVKSFQP